MKIRTFMLMIAAFLGCRTLLEAGEPPRLLLPDEFYAVPGIETNVYFKNVFKTIDHSRFFFQVSCSKGKLMERFWTFTPTAADAGVYDWTLSVFDDNGKVAEKTIKLKVLPVQKLPAGTSILMIGDSLTDQSHHVRHLRKLLPDLIMIGSNGGLGKDPAKTGIAHEGYGGWRWDSFAKTVKPFIPKRLSYRYNRFLIEKDGRWVHSFKDFFKKYANGKSADFITIQLGGNDIFNMTDSNIDKGIGEIGRHMETLIKAIRKDAPEAFIGIGLVPTPAGQDAWGKGYGCRNNSFQFMKNRWKLNQLYMKKVAELARKDKKISIIPVVLGLDPDSGYPASPQRIHSRSAQKISRQSNALHPHAVGGAQIGDIYYCWLMKCLSGK